MKRTDTAAVGADPRVGPETKADAHTGAPLQGPAGPGSEGWQSPERALTGRGTLTATMRLLVGMLLLVALAMGVAACGQANGNSTPAATVRNFMLAGEAHDFDRAYSLFATDEMDRTQIEALLKDYVLFDRFEDLKVDRWMVFAPPDSDRGRLVGTLAYGGGYGGRFEAEMLQRKDGWRLTKMNIIVSREKLQQYEQPTLASPLTPTPAN